MNIRLVQIAFLFLAGIPLSSAAQSTKAVSLQYLEWDASMMTDSLRTILAESFSFHDPTGDVFETGPLGMTVKGVEEFLELQAGWGLDLLHVARGWNEYQNTRHSVKIRGKAILKYLDWAQRKYVDTK